MPKLAKPIAHVKAPQTPYCARCGKTESQCECHRLDDAWSDVINAVANQTDAPAPPQTLDDLQAQVLELFDNLFCNEMGGDSVETKLTNVADMLATIHRFAEAKLLPDARPAKLLTIAQEYRS